MKIGFNKLQKAMKLYDNQRGEKSNKAQKGVQKRDQFELSKEAQEFQVAMKALKATPDVRQEKIDAIKGQIQSDTYKLDPEKIAKKMLEGRK